MLSTLFTLARLSQIVRGHIEAAGLVKTGSSHLLRHSMATAMLEGGADIRFIQAILGHADLSTTQIYTHVSIRQLQKVHELTHPTARLRRQEAPRASGTDGVHPVAVGRDDREELDAGLVADDEEDACDV